jgi:hypothetical protein
MATTTFKFNKERSTVSALYSSVARIPVQLVKRGALRHCGKLRIRILLSFTSSFPRSCNWTQAKIGTAHAQFFESMWPHFSITISIFENRLLSGGGNGPGSS